MLEVSRRHLELRVSGSSVEVTDLGSTNGSWLAQWDESTGSFSAARRIPVKTPVSLGARERLTLAGVVQVERSGQRFPTALPPGIGSDRRGEPASVVVSHDGRTD